MTYSLEELKAMIPIYLNGSLPESEVKVFEEGLKRHPALEKELKAFSEIRESYAVVEDSTPLDSDALFERVRHGIRSESQQVSADRSGGLLAQLFQLVRRLYHKPALSWSLAGLQFAALLAVFFLIPQQPLFKTYTSTRPAEHGRVRINVVFLQEAKEIEIRTLLQELGATIISGPNAEGLYVLDIPGTTDMDGLLRKLDQSPIVRLAEKSLSQLGRQRPSPQACHDLLQKGGLRPAISSADARARVLEHAPDTREQGFEC